MALSSSSTKVKLTERSAAEASAVVIGGEPHPCLYMDTQRTGFGLAVSAKGVKSFVVQRRVAGKQVRFVFGKFGELTVAEARVHAEQLLAKMAMGENPVQKRAEAREEAERAAIRGITLGEALTNYEAYLKAKRRSDLTLAAT